MNYTLTVHSDQIKYHKVLSSVVSQTCATHFMLVVEDLQKGAPYSAHLYVRNDGSTYTFHSEEVYFSKGTHTHTHIYIIIILLCIIINMIFIYLDIYTCSVLTVMLCEKHAPFAHKCIEDTLKCLKKHLFIEKITFMHRNSSYVKSFLLGILSEIVENFSAIL